MSPPSFLHSHAPGFSQSLSHWLQGACTVPDSLKTHFHLMLPLPQEWGLGVCGSLQRTEITVCLPNQGTSLCTVVTLFGQPACTCEKFLLIVVRGTGILGQMAHADVSRASRQWVKWAHVGVAFASPMQMSFCSCYSKNVALLVYLSFFVFWERLREKAHCSFVRNNPLRNMVKSIQGSRLGKGTDGMDWSVFTIQGSTVTQASWLWLLGTGTQHRQNY